MATFSEIQSQSDAEFAKDFERWHEERKRTLDSEYGWLSLRSIDWLVDGDEVTIPKFPGRWRQEGDTVIYTPEPGETVTNRGVPITAPKTIRVKIVADVNVEDFDYEGVRAQLIKRIGSDRQFAVRQRDPRSKTRRAFRDIPHYAPDKRWVVPASYEPLPQRRNVETGAVLGDLSHNETAIGALHFDLGGEHYRLTVLQGHNDDSGWTRRDPATGEIEYLDNRQNTEHIGFVLFRDATSGHETYGGGRTLHIDITHPDALDHLDLNRITNLPCSFTPFCTCPFAPIENNLPIAIPAGEQTPTIVDALPESVAPAASEPAAAR